MMITLDVNLRLPNITVGNQDDGGHRIINTESRFWTVMDVPALPKVGDILELSCRSHAFSAVVKRVDWHDGKDRFVVACHYARRSMTPAMYESLRTDPNWVRRSLLPAGQGGST